MSPKDLKEYIIDLTDTLRTMLPVSRHGPGIMFFPVRLNRDLTVDYEGYIHEYRQIPHKKPKHHKYRISKYFANNDIGHDEIMDILGNLGDYASLVKLYRSEIGPGDIISCRNTEIRRYLLEEYGFERFFNQLNGYTVHVDEYGELIKFDWHENEEPVMVVKVKDSSTGRNYIIRVPPGMKRAKQAVAWTFGKDENDYNPVIQT
jgi:hypothetical protein